MIPAETADTVTVAVDATAAVVAEVPEGGLLLAHHPLLLRGVDTVAASTAKGALVHQMIRNRRALFTAHTNADSASPGVSDALADVLGLTVEDVLEPIVVGPGLDKWVVFVPAENAEAVRDAMFAAGAGHIGDYSHCSWSVAGTGQFLPLDGATPAIGSVGTVERVPEDRVEVIAPSRMRGQVLAAMRDRPSLRGARVRRHRPRARLHADVGLGRIGSLAEAGAVVRLRVPGARRPSRNVVGDACVRRFRSCGVAGGGVRGCGRFVARPPSRAPACRPMSPPTCATILPTSTGARRTSRLVDVAHWASEFPWCAAGGRPVARPFR